MTAISERFNNPGPRARHARTVQAKVALSTPRTGPDQGGLLLRNWGTRFTLELQDGRSVEVDLDHADLDFLIRSRAEFDAIYGRPDQPARIEPIVA